jgi:2-succinyl-5-enolpyruvyl-6-hydroxy-3-cyclohexene-1-carboxylate synthase
VDPHGVAAVVLADPIEPLLEAWGAQLDGLAAVDDGRWRQRWEAVATAAAGAIDEVLATAGTTEPGVARALVRALPAGARLVASSSMPIRDLEWYVPGDGGVSVLSNRGANGIDGVVSTAVGVAAASSGPTGLLIGDVAFLHDSNGLLGAAARGIDLVIVVVDNDGGGIFSFLPQADALDGDRFEQLFGTPHGVDLAALARVHGAATATIGADEPVDALRAALDAAVAAGGLQVVVVGSDRAANRATHQRLNQAVATAARAGLDV